MLSARGLESGDSGSRMHCYIETNPYIQVVLLPYIDTKIESAQSHFDTFVFVSFR